MINNSGLILEGGGMRGIYTAGILDYFMEQNLYFKSIYAVSAGACHACSYISKQQGRAFRIGTEYLNDKRYCSMYSLIRTGDLFGVDMCYDIIPNQLDIYDYEKANNYEGNFFAVVTNCNTGKPEYLKVKDLRKDLIAVRASSSLPLVSRNVVINGQDYLDGGISDSIPIAQSIKDGNKKNVVVLTRSADYRKEPDKHLLLAKIKYKKHPKFVESMKNRYIRYNECLNFINEENLKGNAFILRPKVTPPIERIEKDKRKLKILYNIGYEDAKENYNSLMEFLK